VTPHLGFDQVAFAYGSTVVVDGVSIGIGRGDVVALIGPNGAGKTTLLNLGSGTIRPARGRVSLDGASLVTIPARLRARRIAMVPQALTIPFAYTVREVVALGRTPYVSSLGREAAADRAAIAEAMAESGTRQLADRSVLDLSAGERQRVILAMALAQQPELLLLDEPTANLDLAHQLAFMRLIRELSRSRQLTVLAAIHDLNLAALCFDRIVALHRGHVVADGTPGDVLRQETIEATFDATVRVVEHPTEPVPLIALTWPTG
jgi:iron complex transport system ATP-binding protein